MNNPGFRAAIDAWRQGKATQDEVETALSAEVAANPLLIPAARTLIDSYRQAGHIPVPFADRLRGIEGGRTEPVPFYDRTLPWVPPAVEVKPPEPPPLMDAPFYPWVPGVAVPADIVPDKPASDATDPAVDAALAAAMPAGIAPESAQPAVRGRNALSIGSTLASEYVLESVVPGGDRGGMGVVFKARDLVKERALDPNPFVAIKVLNEDFKRHPESMTALQREYKRGLQLSHPNIVRVQACTQDGIDVFMVMELLEGQSLSDALSKVQGMGLPPTEALRITAALSRALGYAHRLRIVHSDFKPRNAFITHDETIKVLDFGIARALMGDAHATTTPHARSLGAISSAYASSEQIEGEPPDPRDDVYALAVVTYELFTGRHPFDRRDAVSARNAGLKPRKIAGLTRAQWKTLRDGLSFSRDRRPVDAQVFGEGMTPRREPARITPAGAIALAMLILAGILFAVHEWDQRRSNDIAAALASPDALIADGALTRLGTADRNTRDAVLAADGTKAKLMSIYVRQARAMFDPRGQLYDYPRAHTLLESAKRLLPSYDPLMQYTTSLEKQRQLILDRLSEAFERALASHTLLEDDGPGSVLATRRIVAQIDPAYPLLSDPRVPRAFQDAAVVAWSKADLDRADRLVAQGLSFSPSDPGLSDVAERMRRKRTAPYAPGSACAAATCDCR